MPIYIYDYVWMNFEIFQNLLQEAKRKLGEVLSAFEFLDIHSMDMVNPFNMVVFQFYSLLHRNLKVGESLY